MTRIAMWALLAVVALAAAVLSFSALRDLAMLCGFHERLAWLLPVVVDAGAATGCLIWLGTGSAARALRFARALTWVLLASSVAGNAVVHYLAAYSLHPAWWLVVLVSAVAPTVLGSVTHLAVLVSREVPLPDAAGHDEAPDFIPADIPAAPVAPSDDLLTRARALGPGAGRRTVARTLGVSDYKARTLLERLAQEAELVP